MTEWNETYELLRSVPGIGSGMAFTLRGELPELGGLSNRQVGAAAYNLNNGAMKGRPAPIRTVLYMAMLSAIQCNPIMKHFYSRLATEGKHKKAALTACMRKMMTVLNAMPLDGKAWQEV